MTRRIEFTVPDEVGEQYDRARGHEPLASWIKRALESALGNSARVAPASDVSPRGPRASRDPAPTRTPKTRDQLAMERQRKLNERKS